MDTATTEVLRKVNEIAALAGYTVQPHDQVEDMLVCPFDMGGGRSQIVYIHPVGQTPDGMEIISFFSPCAAVKQGFLNGLSKRHAVDLLRRNGMLLGGQFAVVDFGNIDLLVVRSTQIVDTMEVEEFRMHANLVAMVADDYEREMGTDVF